MDIEAKRAARRAAMPITTALLEEYAEFSPKVIWAKENSISAGKRDENENAFTLPPSYLRPFAPVTKEGGK